MVDIDETWLKQQFASLEPIEKVILLERCNGLSLQQIANIPRGRKKKRLKLNTIKVYSGEINKKLGIANKPRPVKDDFIRQIKPIYEKWLSESTTQASEEQLDEEIEEAEKALDKRPPSDLNPIPPVEKDRRGWIFVLAAAVVFVAGAFLGSNWDQLNPTASATAAATVTPNPAAPNLTTTALAAALATQSDKTNAAVGAAETALALAETSQARVATLEAEKGTLGGTVADLSSRLIAAQAQLTKAAVPTFTAVPTTVPTLTPTATPTPATVPLGQIVGDQGIRLQATQIRWLNSRVGVDFIVENRTGITLNFEVPYNYFYFQANVGERYLGSGAGLYPHFNDFPTGKNADFSIFFPLEWNDYLTKRRQLGVAWFVVGVENFPRLPHTRWKTEVNHY